MEGWSIAVSVITAITAIIAVIISVTQIRVSNAQFLFEKRLNIVLLIEDLMALFKSVNYIIAGEDRSRPAFVDATLFVYLTNNSYLHEMANELNEPQKNADDHKVFLTKLEWLRAKARECPYFFKGKNHKILSDFIQQYSDFLACIHKYRICMSHMEKYDPSIPVVNDELENQVRKDYYNQFDVLNETYKLLENGVLDEAKKYIKL